MSRALEEAEAGLPSQPTRGTTPSLLPGVSPALVSL